MLPSTTTFLPLLLAQAEDAPPLPQVGDAPGIAIESQEGAPLGAPGTPGAPGDASARQGTGPDTTFIWIILLGFVVLWVFMISGQRKEKKKRAALLAAIKKGDKVQTVGGILGTVIEVRDAEVVVKVDENANTRMRFARSAIQSIVADKAE